MTRSTLCARCIRPLGNNYLCMRLLYTLLFILTSLCGFSRPHLQGYVTDKNQQSVIGALVRWENTNTGVSTNENGFFELSTSGQKAGDNIIISYIGFQDMQVPINDFDSVLQIELAENNELGEVVITKMVPGTIKSRIGLLDTERVGRKELNRAACCSLAESFETNPSVDVSFSDAVTGAKQIQLLGLAGSYVQQLTENYPNFRGSASVYGLDYIPGPWMESIQISKGASSVKNGYESITGQMNVEYKKPQTADPLSLNMYADAEGRYEGNGDAAIKINENLATGIFLHYSKDTKVHDKNDDGFADYPKKHQFNVMNRWFYNKGRFLSQNGIRFVQDYRESGQITKADKSLVNPYIINIKANRGEFFTKNAYMLNDETGENLALIFTGSYQDQKSNYGSQRYNAYHSNLYGSLIYENNFGKQHNLSSGLSMNWDNFVQSIHLNQQVNPLPNKETTLGAYAQYTFNLDDKLIAMGGIRADYSNLYHGFVTPRLHLKYMPATWVNIRGSLGMGYRTVFVMPENSYFLASSRKIEIADNLKQDKAVNYGISTSFYIPIGSEDLELSLEWYHTRFINQVVTDVDSNPHAVQFYNLDGRSYSTSIQAQASYNLFTGFHLLAAYRWLDTKTNYKGQMLRKPLTSKYKAMLTASYETSLRKWQFDFTTQFNGGGRMPTPDVQQPLWSKDFAAYTVINAQITRNFKNWSVYVGGENLGNKMQHTTIIGAADPYGKDFDATMIWGPTMGRKLYMGLRYTLF